MYVCVCESNKILITHYTWLGYMFYICVCVCVKFQLKLVVCCCTTIKNEFSIQNSCEYILCFCIEKKCDHLKYKKNIEKNNKCVIHHSCCCCCLLEKKVFLSVNTTQFQIDATDTHTHTHKWNRMKGKNLNYNFFFYRNYLRNDSKSCEQIIVSTTTTTTVTTVTTIVKEKIVN